MRCVAILAAVLAFSLAGAALAEPRVPHSRAEIGLSMTPVVQAAGPAVVNIYARRIVPGRASPFADDPFFGPFFRDFGRVAPREQTALGSGVIVSPDGLVVSNTHVVGEAQEIRVVLADRREFDADLVLADAASDLAVLRLRGGEGLPVLELRDSDAVEVGELVLAIGNPFGLGQTVSMGIVSGLARSGLALGDGRGYFLQTDAAINPGNSGGALVDTAGRLIGINTAILSRSGGSQGVGFAVPANLVAQVVAQAAAGATRFRRPWAGIAAQPLDAGLAEGFGLDRPQGVVLADLHPLSPFAEAGFRPGDVVLALDGAPVDSPAELLFRLSAAGLEGTALVTRLRGGEIAEVAVALTLAPETPPRAPRTMGRDSLLSGLTVETVNPAVIAERDLPLATEGVLVTSLGGVALRSGLRPGDVLLAVNDTPVVDSAALEAALRRQARLWDITLLRDGRRLSLRLRG